MQQLFLFCCIFLLVLNVFLKACAGGGAGGVFSGAGFAVAGRVRCDSTSANTGTSTGTKTSKSTSTSDDNDDNDNNDNNDNDDIGIL